MERDELKKRMKGFRRMLDNRLEKCQDAVCDEMFEILSALSDIDHDAFSDDDRDREKNLNEYGEMSEKDTLGEAVAHLTESISHEFFNLRWAEK
ncbi:MAG: hypothetical protein LUD72_06475 [Bacteroidales bacterium]|nr:hypothetical protein [Bacteroidales bacterium]